MYNYSMIYTYVQVWVWSLSSRVLLPLEEEVLRKLDSLWAGTKVPFSPGKAFGPGGRVPAQIPSFPQGKVPFFPRDKVFITGVHGDPRLDLPAKTPPVRIAGFFSQGTSDELAKVLQFCLFNKTRSVWRSAPPSCGGRGITRLLVTIIIAPIGPAKNCIERKF